MDTDDVRVVTTSGTPTAVIAETTSWDAFPARWRVLLGRAHARVLEWCTAHGHAVDGVRWEIYGHWAEDQDPDRFETEVYWLLEPARDGGRSTPE